MPSDKQREASRRNGKKSRGPTSPAGKRRAARNCIRHGLLAQAVVLDEEDAELFERLLRRYTDEHHPTTAVAHALVENMAVARWRQMRLWAMEKEGLQQEIRNQHDPGLTPAGRAAQVFRALTDQSRALDLMNRYETRYDRQFARAHARLLEISKRTQEVVDSKCDDSK